MVPVVGCSPFRIVALATVGLVLAGSAAAVHVELERVAVAGGVIEFHPRPCPSRHPDPTALQPMGRAGAWELLVDRDNEKPGQNGETFHYFVYLSSDGTPQHCFQLTAIPSGNFLDHRSTVRLRVVDGGQQIPGDLQLVLHNGYAAPDFVEAEPLSNPSRADLSGRLTAWLKLVNRLPDVAVTVNSVEVEVDNRERWRLLPVEVRLPSASSAYRLGPGRTVERAVRIDAVASRGMALAQAINPITDATAPQTLTARIAYTTAGGVLRHAEVAFPVRFQPSIFDLFLALSLGVLVGSAGLTLIPAHRGERGAWVRRWLRAASTAAPLALILELSGLVLVAGGSRFQLFAVNLDPNQLTPAFLIGAFAAFLGVEIFRATVLKPLVERGAEVLRRLKPGKTEDGSSAGGRGDGGSR